MNAVYCLIITSGCVKLYRSLVLSPDYCHLHIQIRITALFYPGVFLQVSVQLLSSGITDTRILSGNVRESSLSYLKPRFVVEFSCKSQATGQGKYQTIKYLISAVTLSK